MRRGKLNTNFADLLVALLDARKAGEERRDIRVRSMRGKRQKVMSGRVIGLRPPFGYRLVRDTRGKVETLAIDETSARIIRLVFQWYVEGDETGKRLAAEAISRRLSQMRVPTPGERNGGYHRKRGSGMWNVQTIFWIISSEVYTGVYRYGSLIGSTNLRRPIEETVTSTVPAIISRETWERAQAQRVINKAMAKRNGKHNYLLSGRIRCHCGRVMCGDQHEKKLIYTCSTHRQYYKDLEYVPCKGGRVRAAAIEMDIWDEVTGLFSDLDRLWSCLKEAQQAELTEQDPKRSELEAIVGLLKEAEREADDIAATLRIALGKVGERVQRQQDDCNALIDELTTRRERVIAELSARKLTDEAVDRMMQFASDVRAGLENATFEGQRRILETLDVRVSIKEGRYFLNCLLGQKEGVISKLQVGTGRRIVSNSP